MASCLMKATCEARASDTQVRQVSGGANLREG
jgi:hypothetical protein